MAALAVIEPSIFGFQDRTEEDECGIAEIDAVLIEVVESFAFISLELHAK